jgi:hypothetical protein
MMAMGNPIRIIITNIGIIRIEIKNIVRHHTKTQSQEATKNAYNKNNN